MTTTKSTVTVEDFRYRPPIDYSRYEKTLRYDSLYIDIAQRISEMSYAVRLKVGCVVVKNDCIITHGWNGMPSGETNVCEDESVDGHLVTKPEVLHAEENAILKAAKSGISLDGGVMYCTAAPCVQCSKMIARAGIRELVYGIEYKSTDGLEHLKSRGVRVRRFT